MSELEDLHKNINEQATQHIHAGEIILTYALSKTVELVRLVVVFHLLFIFVMIFSQLNALLSCIIVSESCSCKETKVSSDCM